MIKFDVKHFPLADDQEWTQVAAEMTSATKDSFQICWIYFGSVQRIREKSLEFPWNIIKILFVYFYVLVTFVWNFRLHPYFNTNWPNKHKTVFLLFMTVIYYMECYKSLYYCVANHCFAFVVDWSDLQTTQVGSSSAVCHALVDRSSH